MQRSSAITARVSADGAVSSTGTALRASQGGTRIVFGRWSLLADGERSFHRIGENLAIGFTAEKRSRSLGLDLTLLILQRRAPFGPSGIEWPGPSTETAFEPQNEER
jgi:hypothetical protein